MINLFDVDPKSQENFKAAWLADGKFFAAQPGCISAQLHQGILGSLKFLNYAVFKNTGAFAATNRRPEFGPLRKVYPEQRRRPPAPVPAPQHSGDLRGRGQQAGPSDDVTAESGRRRTVWPDHECSP